MEAVQGELEEAAQHGQLPLVEGADNAGLGDAAPSASHADLSASAAEHGGHSSSADATSDMHVASESGHASALSQQPHQGNEEMLAEGELAKAGMLVAGDNGCRRQ